MDSIILFNNLAGNFRELQIQLSDVIRWKRCLIAVFQKMNIRRID